MRTALAAMRATLAGPIGERVWVIDEAVRELEDGRLSDERARTAEREAHRLAGLLGVIGYPRGSVLAREIELRIGGLSERRGEQCRERVSCLISLVQDLRRELSSPPASAERTGEDQQSPRVLIIETDPVLAVALLSEARNLDLRTELVTGPAVGRGSSGRERPDVVLLDPAGGLDEATRQLLADLSRSRPPVPVVMLQAEESLDGRLEAARLGVRVVLPRRLPVREVMDVVSRAAEEGQAITGRILAVDDDPLALALLREQLAPLGCQVTTVEDPMELWELINGSPPDLLVLDIDMPRINGLELCRVLRTDPRFERLPVLMLTGRCEAEAVRDAFAAGADDFVAKPYAGPELLARIRNRLERSKLHHRLAEIDPLTGLGNRRGGGRDLRQLLRMACRQKLPMSLVMLDVDQFKQMNDQHGHAVGDAVLGRIGRLLLGSFRAEDVAVRWGGGEFVVGLHGMVVDRAVERIGRVMDRLLADSFTGADGAPFQVSFSAGVAEYPRDGADLQALLRTAGAALYAAKAQGRQRIVAKDGMVEVLSEGGPGA